MPKAAPHPLPGVITDRARRAVQNGTSEELSDVADDLFSFLIHADTRRESGEMSMALANALKRRGSTVRALSVLEDVGGMAAHAGDRQLRARVLDTVSGIFNATNGREDGLKAAKSATIIFDLSAPNSKKYWQPTANALTRAATSALLAGKPALALNAAAALGMYVKPHAQNFSTVKSLLQSAAWAAYNANDFLGCTTGCAILAELSSTPAERNEIASMAISAGYAAGLRRKDYRFAAGALEMAFEIAADVPQRRLQCISEGYTLMHHAAQTKDYAGTRALCETMSILIDTGMKDPAIAALVKQDTADSINISRMVTDAGKLAEDTLKKLGKRGLPRNMRNLTGVQVFAGMTTGGAKMT